MMKSSFSIKRCSSVVAMQLTPVRGEDRYSVVISVIEHIK